MKILLYTLFKTTNSLKGILLYNVHLFAFHLPCFLSYRPMVGSLRLCHKWCVVWSLSATNVDWAWEMFCWRITKKRVSQNHSKYNLSTVHGLNLMMFLQKNLKELMYTCTSLIFLFKEFSTKSLERDQQKLMGNPRFQEYKMFVSRNIHLLDK